MKTLLAIYKSPREDELYLYVRKQDGLNRVPEALLERFGKPMLVTTLLMTPEQKLARADPGKVLAAVADNGFYLQLPPPGEAYMQEVNLNNHRLPGR